MAGRRVKRSRSHNLRRVEEELAKLESYPRRSARNHHLTVSVPNDAAPSTSRGWGASADPCSPPKFRAVNTGTSSPGKTVPVRGKPRHKRIEWPKDEDDSKKASKQHAAGSVTDSVEDSLALTDAMHRPGSTRKSRERTRRIVVWTDKQMRRKVIQISKSNAAAAAAASSDTQSNEINEKPGLSMMPDGVLLEIFGKLTNNTLINVAPVCKRWSELTKHKSLWLHEDAVYERYHTPWFLRRVRAAKYLRLLDVSDLQAEDGELLNALMNGPTDVRRFSCFCVAEPRVIVHMLERYEHSLEELNIALSDERISFGEGGTFKNGVQPRPGRLFGVIGRMENLRVLRFTGSMPSIAAHQGRVDPKWYFGELESPALQLRALSMRIENPRKMLVERFIAPFLKSKAACLQELRLTSDLWKFSEVQEAVNQCTSLQAILRFPIERISALHGIKNNLFLDLILAGWTNYTKVQLELMGMKSLDQIEEVSLRFCDQLYPNHEEKAADKRLEVFLPALGNQLKSLKRLHIYRWDATPPFVESVHSSQALHKLLHSVRNTIEEVHISDAFRGGRNLPQLMKAMRGSAPKLRSRGIFINRLGNRGLLFSVHDRLSSRIANTRELLLEYGKAELGIH